MYGARNSDINVHRTDRPGFWQNGLGGKSVGNGRDLHGLEIDRHFVDCRQPDFCHPNMVISSHYKGEVRRGIIKVFNNKSYKTLRQTLRHNMSQPERILWQKLRAKQMYGYKFRRQYGIDNFVVDFYCTRARLAIEIDGETHYGKNRKCDLTRQNHIESFKIRFLRFTNKEVTRNLVGVLERIMMELNPHSSPLKRGRNNLGL